MDIEREVQARVDFKMNELLTSLENTAKANWNVSLQNNSIKHSHYWECFTQMKQMLIKETKMAPPYKDMAEEGRIKKRDEAIDKIMDRFCKRGERDYHHKEQLLVAIIEQAQKW